MINKNNITIEDINSGGINNNTMAKKSTSISVSEEVLEKFRKYCSDNCINRSALFEKWILKYMDGKGE